MNRRRPYARRLRDTRCFSGTSLIFAILASLASAAMIPALGGGRSATIAGAALSPVLVALITTKGRGPVRRAGIVALSGLALVISIGAFTVPEAIKGHGSLTGRGSGTFVRTERFPKSTPPQPSPSTPRRSAVAAPPAFPKPTPHPTIPADLKLELPDSRECPRQDVGLAVMCKNIVIRNAGTQTVEIAMGEPEGAQAGDFTLTRPCNGMLKPDTACSAQVMFLPTAPGPRESALVVHVKPGGGEHRITITGTASALRPAS